MSFRSLIRPLAVEMIEAGQRVIVADVVREAQRRYPAEFVDETQRLAFNAATREAKDVLKTLTEDDDSPQLELPGLALPSVIALPSGEGEFIYKATASCTWPELEAGEHIRKQNVVAAVAKLDTYRANLDVLRPVMKGTSLTAAQAARKLVTP